MTRRGEGVLLVTDLQGFTGGGGGAGVSTIAQGGRPVVSTVY